jgi:amino acid permease
MPIATYAFVGVEIVAVTAVEAKNPTKSLKRPAKNIAWITGLIYFISIIAFYFNVSWQDPHLPGYHLRDGTSTAANKSTALIIIAAENAEVPALPSILTAFLIIAVLSAANTALYVASRTAWGVACDFDPQLINSSNPAKHFFSKLSTTTPRKVPGWALLVSCFFIWIPILQAVTKGGVSNQNVRVELNLCFTNANKSLVAASDEWICHCGSCPRLGFTMHRLYKVSCVVSTNPFDISC